MALSATPGKDKQKINEVIEKLMIQDVQAMVEGDPELLKYTHSKEVSGKYKYQIQIQIQIHSRYAIHERHKNSQKIY